MPITTHSSPPTKLHCGDTYQWTDTPDSIGDVTGYTVVFRSIDDTSIAFTVAGSDQSTHYLFALAGATTAPLPSGEYTITRLVTYSWGRETESAGLCQFLPNPGLTEPKTFNERIVELLEQHLEGRLPEGLESHTIGGVPINKIPLTEANGLLSEYRQRVHFERNAKKALANPDQGSGNTVHLHF